MDEKLAHFIRGLVCNPGTSEDKIREAQTKLGISLPRDYIDFITECNGAEGPIGKQAYLALWPIEDIPVQNGEYRVEEFAPGLLLFGSDGGEEGYGFDTRSATMPIVEVPFIGMSRHSATVCAQTFAEFLEFLYNWEYKDD